MATFGDGTGLEAALVMCRTADVVGVDAEREEV